MPEKAWDVIILGGGLQGCTIAWRLAQHGLSCLLIEKGDLASGASRAAAGILAPQAEADSVGPLLTLGRESLQRFPSFLDELSVPASVGLTTTGLLSVAYTEAEESLLRARAQTQRQAGLSVEVLSTQEVVSLEPRLRPPRCALYFAEEAALDPLPLTYAVAEAAQQQGAMIRTHCEAQSICVEAGGVTGVQTHAGLLRATRVVVAMGAWSGLLQGSTMTAREVFPIRGQLLRYDVAQCPVSRVVYSHHGYVVPRPSGAVLVGATMEKVGFENVVTDDATSYVRELGIQLLPSLAAESIGAAWAGLRPQSFDGMPLLGPTEVKNLYLATGHFRNGILLAPITAELLLEMIVHERTPSLAHHFLPSRRC